MTTRRKPVPRAHLAPERFVTERRIRDALEALGILPSQMLVEHAGNRLYRVRFFILPNIHFDLKISENFTTSDYRALFARTIEDRTSNVCNRG